MRDKSAGKWAYRQSWVPHPVSSSATVDDMHTSRRRGYSFTQVPRQSVTRLYQNFRRRKSDEMVDADTEAKYSAWFGESSHATSMASTSDHSTTELSLPTEVAKPKQVDLPALDVSPTELDVSPTEAGGGAVATISTLSSPMASFDASFEINEEIGRGGAAVVYAGLNKADGSMVAVKVLHKNQLASMLENRRLRDEIRSLQGLRHPSIVPLYGTFEDERNLLLVLERARGGECAPTESRIARRRSCPTSPASVRLSRSLASCSQTPRFGHLLLARPLPQAV